MKAVEMRIVEPRWTRPVWTRQGQTFPVVVEGGAPEPLEMVLHTKDGVEPLAVVSIGRVAGQRSLWHMLCRVAEQTPDGLCAVEVISARAKALAPNSVCVLREFPGSFTFVHTSDLHLAEVGEKGLLDRRPLAEALVERINAFSPAFVLNTGDLVTRYDGEKRRLPDKLIWWQAREARRIFLKLQMPTFVIPGNHDVAFCVSRAAWTECMGAPWDRDTDDYGFDFGDCHFAALGGFVHCDEVTFAKGDHARTTEQLSWLRDDLRAAAHRRLRVVFVHYDYEGEIEKIVREEGCDLFLDGHAGRVAKGEFPCLRGRVAGGMALELWRVEDGVPSSEGRIGYEELGETPSLDVAAVM